METLVDNSTLQPGEMLNWYRIERVLGRGGFGITYLAFDSNLKMDVAIKEYSPELLSRRGADKSVYPKRTEDEVTFNWGLTSFLNEARTLVRFKHPNIVRVMAVFEANKTAYMIMEFESGQDLKALLSKTKKPNENYLKNLILPVIDGLAEVHRCGFIHRDIKPANIYIRVDGTPVLLDFGSARLAHSDATQNLTTLVSAGFTPFEQYGNTFNQNQGPWTDIYSLGAVLYFAITGNAPPDCTFRASAVLSDQPDPIQRISIKEQGNYSPGFLSAIDRALEFKVSERPKTLEAWRSMLLSDDMTVRRPHRNRNDSITAQKETESILQRLSDPGNQKYRTRTARGNPAEALEEHKLPFDDTGWNAPVPIGPSDSPARPKRKPQYMTSALAASTLVFAGFAGNWIWQRNSDNASPAGSVSENATNPVSVQDMALRGGNTRISAEDNKRSDILTQQARDADAARQKELAARQAREAEAAEQAELATQQAREAKAAEQAELAAQQVREALAIEKAELADQQAREDEAARQAELAARQAQEAEAAEQAELAARQAREAEVTRRAELAARQAREAEVAKQAELAAQQVREAVAAEQVELAAQRAREAEAKKQAELADQQEREAEAKKQAELADQQARETEAKEQAELAAQQAREAETKRQAELAARQAREAEAKRQAELAARQAREAEAAKQAKLATRTITDSDIQAAASRFNELVQAIRSRNLREVRKLTSPANKYDDVFTYWFNNYVEIDIELSDFTANRTQGSVNAKLTVNRLIRSNGNIVLPTESLKTIPIAISRANENWLKINWSDRKI